EGSLDPRHHPGRRPGPHDRRGEEAGRGRLAGAAILHRVVRQALNPPGGVMRWVESGDVRLAVLEEGDPAAPTLLLVHGYPDTHRVWDEVAARLRDRFHVVRYDVRGAGRSTAPAERHRYGMDHLAADLAAVIDAIGKPKVHLVGHDWGSLQGWHAAARPGLRERLASFTGFGGPGLAQTDRFIRHGDRKAVAGQLLRTFHIGAFQLPVLPELAWQTFLPALMRRTLPRHPGQDTLPRDARNGLELYRANTFTRRAPVGDPWVDVPVQLIECLRDPFTSAALLESLRQWAPR